MRIDVSLKTDLEWRTILVQVSSAIISGSITVCSGKSAGTIESFKKSIILSLLDPLTVKTILFTPYIENWLSIASKVIPYSSINGPVAINSLMSSIV